MNYLFTGIKFTRLTTKKYVTRMCTSVVDLVLCYKGYGTFEESTDEGQ